MKAKSHIIFKTPCTLRRESVHDIMYIQITNSLTEVIMYQKKPFIVDQTLVYLEELLPISFFQRVNRQMIVNVRYIKRMSLNHVNIASMNNGKEFKIARRRKKLLIDKILKCK